MNLVFRVFVGCLAAVRLGCCDRASFDRSLRLKLDAGDASGAVALIEDGCLSDDEEIQSTKAMLLFWMSMDGRNAQEAKNLRATAVALLEREAESGSSSPTEVLALYREQGEERFLAMFPWAHFIGPGMGPRG
jgi:hypothetical protein